MIKQQCEESHVESARLRDVFERTKVDLKSCQAEVSTMKNATDEMSGRLAAAEAELTAREDIQNQLKRAVEKALQSVVRLCVVAPTVNVHLTNSSSSGAGSIVVACKSILPHKQVKAIVEREVLPLFATVFVQPSHESCSPQGGPMDLWLQMLLRDMQESLATHLQQVYSATTTATPID